MKSIPHGALKRALHLTPLLGVLTACSALGLDPGGDQRDVLHRNLDRWARNEVHSYRYTYSEDCAICRRVGPLVIDVHDGAVATARPVGDAEPLPVTDLGGVPTVRDLFALIARAIDERADGLDVAYDRRLGFPTRIGIDWEFGREDDEFTYVAGDLRRIAPPLGGG